MAQIRPHASENVHIQNFTLNIQHLHRWAQNGGLRALMRPDTSVHTGHDYYESNGNSKDAVPGFSAPQRERTADYLLSPFPHLLLYMSFNLKKKNYISLYHHITWAHSVLLQCP